MLVKSLKHVPLRDETYRGVWMNYVFTIPFAENDEDLEISVSHNTDEPRCLTVHVKNNKFSFEV
jgi:hypothetical protein